MTLLYDIKTYFGRSFCAVYHHFLFSVFYVLYKAEHTPFSHGYLWKLIAVIVRAKNWERSNNIFASCFVRSNIFCLNASYLCGMAQRSSVGHPQLLNSLCPPHPIVLLGSREADCLSMWNIQHAFCLQKTWRQMTHTHHVQEPGRLLRVVFDPVAITFP